MYYSCVMFSLLPLRIFYSLARLNYPGFWIRTYLKLKKKNKIKKNPKDFSKHIVSHGQMELILKRKCTFIWCSYHLNTPFCVILQYPQSKGEILSQKEKQYYVKLHDVFCILYRMDIFFKRLMIYQSGITMNMKNM